MEERLREMMNQIAVPDEENGLSRTIALAREEERRQRRRERISFARFIWMQGKYVGWKIWAAQAGCLLIVTALLLSMFGTQFFRIPVYAVRYACTVSGSVFLCSVPFLSRSVRYNMHELETASYMSARRLLAAKLLWIGTGDAVVLTGLLLFMTMYAPLGNMFLLLCLLLPFLLTAAAGLFFLQLLGLRYVPAACAGVSFIIVLAAILGSRKLLILWEGEHFAGGAFLLLAVLCLLCAYEIRALFRRGNYEELQLSC